MKLKIINCTDPMMWYSKMVGETVPLLRIIENEKIYLSREPAGYSNIVKMCDAEIITESN